MSNLASFHKGSLSKGELMGVAGRCLKPSSNDLALAGLKQSPVDLLQAFEDFMRK